MKRLHTIFASVVAAVALSGCVDTLDGYGPSTVEATDNTQNIWASQGLSVGENSDIDISDVAHADPGASTPATNSGATGSLGVVPRIAFPADEYSRLPLIGKSSVKGKIYITAPNGAQVLGRHTRLYLNPQTSYSEQWFEESYLGGKRMKKADSRLYKYLRFTTSDGNGNFAFYGVPAGEYYLIGIVECGAECGFGSKKIIKVAKEIEVRDSSVLTKDLTRAIH